VTEVAKRRLNFNEKHALETLPKTMAGLHAKIGTLQKRLDDPGLYARDRAVFNNTSDALVAAAAELAAAEEKWLALEILREGIEGG
jgi:ATP-binding cassette subfamily F protein uup